MREYLGYMSNLDRLTYVIVELRSVSMEFRGKIPRAVTKPGYTCMTTKVRIIRIHLKKMLSAGLIFEIEFKTIVSFLLNQNPTCYANVQIADTFAYV